MADIESILKIPLWALLLTVAVALVGGTWALSAEVHNYRLENITTRLRTHEEMLMSFSRQDAEQDIRIDHNGILLEVVSDKLDDIAIDVKRLLEEP